MCQKGVDDMNINLSTDINNDYPICMLHAVTVKHVVW